MIADVLFNTMDNHRACLELCDPTDQVHSKINEDGYADDTSLRVDGQDDQFLHRMSTSAQQHKQILYATGGKLALRKCT